MNNALHFVGFKDDRVHSARRVWGDPDFWHRHWDRRAKAEVFAGDIVVFADGDDAQPVRKYSFDDSNVEHAAIFKE